jgi:hypothetical protein
MDSVYEKLQILQNCDKDRLLTGDRAARSLEGALHVTNVVIFKTMT